MVASVTRMWGVGGHQSWHKHWLKIAREWLELLPWGREREEREN